MDSSSLTPLISSQKIQEKVAELGQQITHDFQGKELVVVGVLRGSFIFMSDLVRHIQVPLQCEFIQVMSYHDNKSTHQVKIVSDIPQSIQGKHVLLVEDIVDGGKTLRFLIKHLKSKKPASLKISSLLYKEIDPKMRDSIDYLGFTVPDEYIVGYGLDSHGYCRSLPELFIENTKT